MTGAEEQTPDAMFEVDRLAPAHPAAFRRRVQDDMRQLGCTVRPGETPTSLSVTEPDGRRAVWVTLSRAEKNDRFGFGWTIEGSARARHRAWERLGQPVMYALQAGDQVRVVPSDFLIEGVTLAEGKGGRSEHVLITDGRWPSLETYLTGRS